MIAQPWQTGVTPIILTVTPERFALKEPFVLARGVKTHADVLTVTLTTATAQGWAECVPYPRYDESLASVTAQLHAVAPLLHRGQSTAALDQLPAGAARNALDCALWDLAAKTAATPVWELAHLAAPRPLTTAVTLSLDTPSAMAQAAERWAGWPVLKIKVGTQDPLARIAAVRAARPDATLIVDPNESWSLEQTQALAPDLARLHIALLEQPIPADQTHRLQRNGLPVPIYADEAVHTLDDLHRLAPCMDGVNIKLDKAGGLTPALALLTAARQQNLGVMVGCMVGSSLAMAPALLLAQTADFIDLDGSLLLAEDRAIALEVHERTLHPAKPALWG